ncbi:MAG: BON domain-containing protein [Rhabdochlamydiaceae bacterium]|nr:BON domain-containing protein [Rhabdochlamydiaceae bacterium]
MKKFLLPLVLCVLSVSCKSNPTSNQNNKTISSPSINNPSVNRPSINSPFADTEISLRVKEALLGDNSLSPSNRLASVTTKNGVVIISGTIFSANQMEQIIKKAQSVSGVKRVDNQMDLSN